VCVYTNSTVIILIKLLTFNNCRHVTKSLDTAGLPPTTSKLSLQRYISLLNKPNYHAVLVWINTGQYSECLCLGSTDGKKEICVKENFMIRDICDLYSAEAVLWTGSASSTLGDELSYFMSLFQEHSSCKSSLAWKIPWLQKSQNIKLVNLWNILFQNLHLITLKIRLGEII